MTDFTTLSCPTCGAKLQITPDIDRFACSSCGNEHIVKRSGGTVSLAPVIAQLSKVGAGVDRTAAELAIARLQLEIKELEAEYVAERARTGPVAGLATAVLILIPLGVSLIARHEAVGSTLFGILALVLAVGGSYFTYVLFKRRRTTLRRIMAQARSKNTELQKNKKIVAR